MKQFDTYQYGLSLQELSEATGLSEHDLRSRLKSGQLLDRSGRAFTSQDLDDEWEDPYEREIDRAPLR